MAALLSRVKKQVNAALNLADAYQETPDSGSRAYEQQLIDNAISIDLEVVRTGLTNPSWAHRVDFQQSATVAHGGTLPSHVGPIDAVIIGGKLASPAPLDQIEAERTLLSMSVTEVTPHFNVDGTILAHNGSSNATVKYCNVTRGIVLQAPDDCEGAVTRGTLSITANPEGEDPAMQQNYANMYASDLQMLARGEMPPPFQQ